MEWISITTIISVLSAIDPVSGIVRKLRDVKANQVYVDLLDTQLRNEAEHLHVDVVLNKERMNSALRQETIQLEREDLTPDAL